MAPQVSLIPLDPYDGKTGLLAPFVLERIRQASREWNFEMDPEQVLASIGQRFYSRDPSLKLLAFMTPDGKLVGHAVAAMETDGVNTWVFISQVRMDPGDWGDAVTRALELADRWAIEYSNEFLIPRGYRPIKHMLMATRREDKGFIKKFKFNSHRHIMEREIPGPQKPSGEGS